MIASLLLAAAPLIAVREFSFDTPVDAVASYDGARGLVVDEATNIGTTHSTLTLFRWDDGTVLDSVKLLGVIGENDFDGPSHILTAPPFVLAWGVNGFDLFRLEGDRLVHVHGNFESFAEVFSAALRPDGTVVVIAWTCTFSGEEFECHQFLLTVLPDGREGYLPLDLSFPDLSLSPSGDLALVGDVDYENPRSVTAIDLTDPAAPVVRWEGFADWSSGVFDGSENRVFATFESGNRNALFDAAILDPISGELVGDRSASVPKNYYHGIGAISGTGPRQRAVVWKWTIAGWKTALFDISGDTPLVLRILPEYFDFPEFLAREDEGWYEIHSDPFGADRGTSILLADADGIQSLGISTPGQGQAHLAAVRRGFIATNTYGFGTVPMSVTLWRDTALNRPPVARGGGDRAVECAGPEGTPVRFDGTGSSDPDSTPGSQDDIASFAWSIDGGAPLSGAAAEAALELGTHAGALVVTDVLGAEGRDDASIDVRDTLAPNVALTLRPVFDGGVWAHQWKPNGAMNDLCDGALGAPAERLRVPEGAAVTPVTFSAGATRAIEFRRNAAGELEVRLFGPNEADARALWNEVGTDGGFPLTNGAPVALQLEAAPKGKAALLVRWDLDVAGRLTGATAYGDTGDFLVDATGADRSGHTATSSVSFRATLAAACAGAPQNVMCAGSGAGRKSAARLTTARNSLSPRK